MGKYEPLGEYLKKQKHAVVRMTFSEIERILQRRLPPSKMHRAWWSNNPNNNVMTKEWLSAGFETEQVDVESGKLVFRRANREMQKQEPHKRPFFGSMKGMIKFAPGFDPTEPTGVDWEEQGHRED